MSKIIKLKQSDLKNIIKNVLNEQMDSPSLETPDETSQDSDVVIGKDENGSVIVFNKKTGQILGKK